MDEPPSVWADPPPAADVAAEYFGDATLAAARLRSDWNSGWSMLSDLAGGQYFPTCPSVELIVFDHGPATYLFDTGSQARSERTVFVMARPEPPAEARDAVYQGGYPLPERIGNRPMDRGHFVPYSGGGLFGPNLFVQDRALNRGWSRQGRLYRATETRAVAAADAVLFARPQYVDDSDIPAFVDLGVVDDQGCAVNRFRNRYDVEASHAEDQLAVLLNGAVSGQIGALGEETAAGYLVEELNATIVAMGDAGMPRDGATQDLDIVAIVDGSLVAFEVKTKFMAKSAGRRTRVGNLVRPRMRRYSTPAAPPQGSQDYVTNRLANVVDVANDYVGIEVRVIAVDFRLMEMQQFAVNDSGTRLSPLGPPVDCTATARAALATILVHRGFL